MKNAKESILISLILKEKSQKIPSWRNSLIQKVMSSMCISAPKILSDATKIQFSSFSTKCKLIKTLNLKTVRMMMIKMIKKIKKKTLSQWQRKEKKMNNLQ